MSRLLARLVPASVTATAILFTAAAMVATAAGPVARSTLEVTGCP